MSKETLAFANTNPSGRVVAHYLGKDVVRLAAAAAQAGSQSEVK